MSNVNVLESRLGLRLTEAARLAGVSPKTLRRWIREGKTPQPHQVGPITLFVADELTEWARLGFPDRDRFESMRTREQESGVKA